MVFIIRGACASLVEAICHCNVSSAACTPSELTPWFVNIYISSRSNDISRRRKTLKTSGIFLRAFCVLGGMSR